MDDTNYVFGALLPGKLRQILVTKAFVCPCEEDGFLLKMQVHEDLTGDGSETFTWVIFKGFGAFEKLRGHGSGSTVSSDWATGPWINPYEGFVVDGTAEGAVRGGRDPKGCSSPQRDPDDSRATPARESASHRGGI